MLEANVPRIYCVGVLTLALALAPVQASAAPKDQVAVVTVGLDMLVFQETSNLSISGEEIRSLGFNVGVYYRLQKMDLGVRVGHLGHGTFQPEIFGNSPFRRAKSVSQFVAETQFRWRHNETTWGGYFSALSLGYAGVVNSDAVLDQAHANALIAEAQGEFSERSIERFHSFLTVGISAGVLIYVSDQIFVPIRLGLRTVFSPKEEPSHFSVLTLWIGTGLEFAP